MDEGELNQTLSEVSGEGLWGDNDDGTQDFVVEDSASNNTIVIAEDMTEGEVDDFMEEMMTAQEAGDYCQCPAIQNRFGAATIDDSAALLPDFLKELAPVRINLNICKRSDARLHEFCMKCRIEAPLE